MDVRRRKRELICHNHEERNEKLLQDRVYLDSRRAVKTENPRQNREAQKREWERAGLRFTSQRPIKGRTGTKKYINDKTKVQSTLKQQSNMLLVRTSTKSSLGSLKLRRKQFWRQNATSFRTFKRFTWSIGRRLNVCSVAVLSALKLLCQYRGKTFLRISSVSFKWGKAIHKIILV